jgi:hypothetical protein
MGFVVPSPAVSAMQAYFSQFGYSAKKFMDSGFWVSVHRIGTRRVVRRSGWLPGRFAMEPITARDLLPRLILGLCLAAAATTGAVALHEFGGSSASNAVNAADGAMVPDGRITTARI